MTPASETPAMAEALAKIEALGKAALEQRERDKSDPRLLWLGAKIDGLDPGPLSDGFLGGQEVFAHLASSKHWRRLRAKSLHIVRQQQLIGHRPSVRWWLAKAREQRRSEKHWLRVERIALCEEIDRRRMDTLRSIDERRAASLRKFDAHNSEVEGV